MRIVWNAHQTKRKAPINLLHCFCDNNNFSHNVAWLTTGFLDGVVMYVLKQGRSQICNEYAKRCKTRKTRQIKKGGRRGWVMAMMMKQMNMSMMAVTKRRKELMKKSEDWIERGDFVVRQKKKEWGEYQT